MLSNFKQLYLKYFITLLAAFFIIYPQTFETEVIFLKNPPLP